MLTQKSGTGEFPFVGRLHRPCGSVRGAGDDKCGAGPGTARSPGTSSTPGPAPGKQNPGAEPSGAVTQPAVQDSVPQGKEFGET